MPAAIVAVPVLGTAIVKSPTAPPLAGALDAFLQVLQSVEQGGANLGARSAANTLTSTTATAVSSKTVDSRDTGSADAAGKPATTGLTDSQRQQSDAAAKLDDQALALSGYKLAGGLTPQGPAKPEASIAKSGASTAKPDRAALTANPTTAGSTTASGTTGTFAEIRPVDASERSAQTLAADASDALAPAPQQSQPDQAVQAAALPPIVSQNAPLQVEDATVASTNLRPSVLSAGSKGAATARKTSAASSLDQAPVPAVRAPVAAAQTVAAASVAATALAIGNQPSVSDAVATDQAGTVQSSATPALSVKSNDSPVTADTSSTTRAANNWAAAYKAYSSAASRPVESPTTTSVGNAPVAAGSTVAPSAIRAADVIASSPTTDPSATPSTLAGPAAATTVAMPAAAQLAGTVPAAGVGAAAPVATPASSIIADSSPSDGSGQATAAAPPSTAAPLNAAPSTTSSLGAPSLGVPSSAGPFAALPAVPTPAVTTPAAAAPAAIASEAALATPSPAALTNRTAATVRTGASTAGSRLTQPAARDTDDQATTAPVQPDTANVTATAASTATAQSFSITPSTSQQPVETARSARPSAAAPVRSVASQPVTQAQTTAPQVSTGTETSDNTGGETQSNSQPTTVAWAAPTPIAQTTPVDAKANALAQSFPALTATATVSTKTQPAVDPSAGSSRNDTPAAVATEAPLRTDAMDLSAGQTFATPAGTAEAAAPTATATAATAAPATPAAQLAPAMVSLGQSANGGQQMTVRLHPADLGMVQVRIDRSADGTASVSITVEKANTMQTLLRDQQQLHQTLDDAGVPSVGRTVTFTMAPDSSLTAGGGGSSGFNQGNPHGSGPNGAGTATDDSTAGGSQTASGQSANGQNTGGQNASGQQSGGRGGYSTQDQGSYPGERRSAEQSMPVGGAEQTAGKRMRVGLDITA